MSFSKTEVMENLVSIQYMNDRVMSLGNEYAEEYWLLDYPDGADFDDQVEMAKDAQIMKCLRSSYQNIMRIWV